MVIRKPKRKRSEGVVKVIGGKEYVLPKKNVYTPVAPEEKPSFPEAKLCLFLGLLFGPFGVLIAAIIAKAPGVIESLKGMGIFFEVIAKPRR